METMTLNTTAIVKVRRELADLASVCLVLVEADEFGLARPAAGALDLVQVALPRLAAGLIGEQVYCATAIAEEYNSRRVTFADAKLMFTDGVCNKFDTKYYMFTG